MRSKKDIETKINQLEDVKNNYKKLLKMVNPKHKDLVELIINFQISQTDHVISWLKWVIEEEH
jgi:hypothetical protein